VGLALVGGILGLLIGGPGGAIAGGIIGAALGNQVSKKRAK
jgi:outer membrane lipoprotein SlyB